MFGNLGKPPTSDPLARAASYVHNILDFRRMLDREQLPPLSLRGVVPLCMEQYKRIFGTTRVPGREADVLHTNASARHITLQCRGHYFSLTPYRRGRLLSSAEIEHQLRRIDAHARRLGPATGPGARVAALTAWNRTRWAEAREACLSEGVAAQSRRAVETGLFHLVLDPAAPETLGEQGALLFHGDGASRWCDKSFNVIVFANGKVGLNAEHSWADAPTLAHMWCVRAAGKQWGTRPPLLPPRWASAGLLSHSPTPFCAARELSCVKDRRETAYDANGRIALPKGRSADAHRRHCSALPAPTHLPFPLDDEADRLYIQPAYAAARALVEDLQLRVVQHDAFGKDVMKRAGVSPDAFIQLVLQLAYYRDQRCFALTYESAMTRLFRDGRTETVRPVSEASCAFVRAFCDENGSKARACGMRG